MDRRIETQKKEEAIYVKKADGTEVYYYLFPEFEIHQNTLPPGTVQGWHAHAEVEETLQVTKGTITIDFAIDQQIKSEEASAGDVVRVLNSIHRIANHQNEAAEFTVFRFISTGTDQHEKIKADKIEYLPEDLFEKE